MPDSLKTPISSAFPATEPATRQFLASVEKVFDRAVEKTGGTRDFDFCLADRVIRLSFAGEALINTFTEAIAHLTVSKQSGADITIRIWEIAETGAVLPPTPWEYGAFSTRGEIAGFNDSAYFTAFHVDSRALFLYDSTRHVGYIVIFDRSELPAYERTAPLRPVLSHALASYNIQYIHAAGVGLCAGGALLAGKGGAGKSTTSLACLDSPLLFAGDDYCAVSSPTRATADNQETAVVYSLYNTAKGDGATVARLPFLQPFIRYWDFGGSDKAIWFLHNHHAHKLISQFPLRVILIPRVTQEQETRVAPAPAHAALLALAPSTIAQLPGANAQVFQRLAAVTRSVPSLYLDLGTDMNQVPQTILRVLAEFGVRP